jgi:adenylate kinase
MAAEEQLRSMNAILIGAPGAGKGTQAFILEHTHGFQRLASGDLLREGVRGRTPLGLVAKRYMDRGDLVPDEIVVQLILEKLTRIERRNGVIFDGFPRTLEQARALEQALGALHERIDAVLYLDVPRETLFERLTQRYQCGDCGAIYNWGVNPPRQEGLCDRCGGGLYQRMDDNEKTVDQRLKAYFQQTMPLIRHYEVNGQLKRIDGDQPVDRVTEQIMDGLEQVRREKQP